MAYKVEYGTGELGDVEITGGAVQNVNSYARVIGISGNAVTLDLDGAYEGAYEKFHAGVEVLIHVSAGSESAELGRYLTAKILLAQNGVLTLDRRMFDVDLDSYYVQAVTIANFDCLKLGAGAVITPPPYNPFKFHGGIVAIKCWEKMEMAGGAIDLTDAGIPVARKNQLRPLTEQETAANGESDYALYSGWENGLTAERLLLNAGDGAAYIVARRLICQPDSRIGNPRTHGAQYCRGAANSVGVRPSNVTNVGGSSILIAAESIEGFTAQVIAKYRSSELALGRGLCRCYIASATKLADDEGLYAFDVLADKSRLQRLGVRDFGDGSFGDLENPTEPLNNYGQVIGVTRGGHVLQVTRQTVRGLAQFKVGALVLVQAVQKSARNSCEAGKITVARILKCDGDRLTLDEAAPLVNLDEYDLQIIAIPQFSNFKLSGEYAGTRKYEKLGGVCALAVSGTCDLRGGFLNVEGCGGVGYGRGLGNAQSADRLALGGGHGSVFILAKEMKCDENTRIGARYSGAGTGGRYGGNNGDGSNAGGGYSGAPDENGSGAGGGYSVGGAGSAAKVGGRQGAHIFIAADTIAGMSVANLSTGGAGGEPDGKPGAAGYGGGGSQSSGGDSGCAFIYTN